VQASDTGHTTLKKGLERAKMTGRSLHPAAAETIIPPWIPASAFAGPGNKMLRPVIDPFGMRKAA
jgi:hypothetical protein